MVLKSELQNILDHLCCLSPIKTKGWKKEENPASLLKQRQHSAEDGGSRTGAIAGKHLNKPED